MNSNKRTTVVAITLLATLSITFELFAQDNSHHKHHQYKIAQIGTFGGPDSDFLTGPAYSAENYFNRKGATVGDAQTDIADPFSPKCFWFSTSCFGGFAFKFENGTLIDLGALPGSENSAAYGINDSGLTVGISENGLTDPATGYPEYDAVVWRHGLIEDLGTLGGSVSQAFAVNHLGQVVGVAANAVPDEYASGLGPCTTVNCWPVTTQQRAFLWQGRELQDLGTLGGNDAVAYFVNDRGQVAGVSYTNTTANKTTGLPTQDPFLWERGRMVDLGSLGGTLGIVYWLNNRGQVAGQSNLAGDKLFHAFLWDRGILTDLGTLGGDLSIATSLSDAGDVVGVALTSGNQQAHGFLWHHGTITDLGTLQGHINSRAYSVNDEGVIVGESCGSTCDGTARAVIWDKGAPADLNALVEPPSNLHLQFAYAIADSGEILVWGTLPNGDIRIAELTPTGDCEEDCEERIAMNLSKTAEQSGRTTKSMTGNGAAFSKSDEWLNKKNGNLRFLWTP